MDDGYKGNKKYTIKIVTFLRLMSWVNEIEKMHPGRIRSGRAIGNYGPVGL